MRLGEVCTINPKAPAFEDDLLVSFVPMPKVGENGEFDPSEEREYQSVKKGFTYFREGDVLFAKITPCMENGKGAVARALRNGIGYGSTEFHVLRPVDGKVLSDWLYYLTSWSVFRKEAEKNMTGSAGQKRVPKAFLENYSVCVPETGIQTVQVEALKQISKLIGLRKLQLEKLDELVKARFVEMFGDPVQNYKKWIKKPFASICENLDSRRVPITSTDRKAGQYPYYGASGIVDYVDDYIFDEDLLLVSEDGANLIMRSTPIAFSVSGKTWVNNHAHVLRFETLALQKYIEVYFSLIDISGSITGTAQPKLNQAKLNEMLFSMPPESLIESFHAFLTQTDKSKVEIQKSLERLETLKKALMQRYFG